MSGTSKRPPNPFETARRAAGVTVRLRPGDLLEGLGASEQQAQALMDRHAPSIAAAMLAAGLARAIELHRQEGEVTQ